MEVSVRHLRQGPDGIPGHADSEVRAEILTIGSGPDSHVQLLGGDVAPAHAVIRGSTISAKGRARLTINGVEARSSGLSPGDVIGIAGHRITVAPTPPGFDLALAIEPDKDARKSDFERAFRTDLRQTWLSRRRTAWALALLTPLLSFLIPFAATLAQRADGTPPSFLDEQIWSAGPLIPAHQQAAGQRCESCHRTFFTAVPDTACRGCHGRIVDHVALPDLAQTQLRPTERCGQCHQEHTGAGTLVARGDDLCVQCHARSRDLFGTLPLAVVSGFSAEGHPGFKATVVRPVKASATQLARLSGRDTPSAGAEALIWEPTRVPVATGEETSNLKFSHKEHLDPGRVQRRADSKALECGDCHVPTPDGTQFQPITMAGSCAGCHELTFDERNPTRQLPHGRPGDAILLIQDYYAHRLMDPGSVPDEPPRRRLPDSAGVTQDCTTGTPQARGACRAAQEALTQFTRRGCVSCHEVSDAGGGASLQERFTVQPVRLVSDYLPGVRFSHRAHAVQKSLTGQTACLSCHGAVASEDSRRLMIPDRGRCLECHGETPARDRVQLQCVSCHAYHADHSERPSQRT